MDKSNMKWWMFPRWSKKYENGVDEYMEKTFLIEGQGNEIRCPCKECHFRNWLSGNVIKDHLIAKGLSQLWKAPTDSKSREEEAVDDGMVNTFDDNVDDLLHDTFRNGQDEETRNFYKLVEDGQEELFPGCKRFSKLSFTIRLFLFKRDHHLSNAAFADLLKILKVIQPDAKLPSSFNEAKHVLKVLGLDYTKIDACPNNCMLYWEKTADAECCHICKTSRWKVDEKDEITGKVSQIQAKVLRYFPIKKRLQRLFMCSKTAGQMRWHANGRPKDDLLRHPADGNAWKNFDLRYLSFSGDERNVRLGLATDGFNPFNTLSIVHSTWPVILSNYNIPPWLSMKPEFLMLALLIPGPSSPGNNIDVYMQPLVKDLKDLWEFRVETYDAYSNQMFKMHAALLFTISDYPAYAMLSGWSTKGKWACPCCHYETCSQWLTHSGKFCYMGHRRFLPMNHPYRRNKRQFNGKNETRSAPVRLTGHESVELLSGFENKFGKEMRPDKKLIDVCPWRKKSIFFELPYWIDVDCRHYLDVMHIEKNVCDNVIGTLLEIPGKNKDHLNARYDLKELGVMQELQPKLIDGGRRAEIARPCFWMTLDEKRRFCNVVKNAKLPQVCDSNIARCVQDRKITGYKSHDGHFLMQYLLPLAAKESINKDVALLLIRLSAYFKGICSKTIDPTDLDYLEAEIGDILCEFERIFPWSFFDIMVHLPIHLVEEIRLGGPVSVRWMYPIERYLRKLKSFVRNKSRPEGSIAEAYLADECVTFCARYLQHQSPIVDEHVENNEFHSIFPKMGHPLFGKGKRKRAGRDHFKVDPKQWAQAHRYVLFNCEHEEVERYISEHEKSVGSKNKRKWQNAQSHNNDFIDWFRERVEGELHQGLHVTDLIKWLSAGPTLFPKRYSGYFINGYKFHTMKRDRNSATENSGVTITASTSSFSSTKDQNPIIGDVTYYGSVEDIIEIFYADHCSVILFGCVWYHSDEDNLGITRVNQKKLISKDDPFILASQSHQVFYVEDSMSKDWYYVVQDLPRYHFDAKDESSDTFAYTYWNEPQCSSRVKFSSTNGEREISHTRADVPATVVDVPAHLEQEEMEES